MIGIHLTGYRPSRVNSLCLSIDRPEQLFRRRPNLNLLLCKQICFSCDRLFHCVLRVQREQLKQELKCKKLLLLINMWSIIDDCFYTNFLTQWNIESVLLENVWELRLLERNNWIKVYSKKCLWQDWNGYKFLWQEWYPNKFEFVK